MHLYQAIRHIHNIHFVKMAVIIQLTKVYTEEKKKNKKEILHCIEYTEIYELIKLPLYSHSTGCRAFNPFPNDKI